MTQQEKIVLFTLAATAATVGGIALAIRFRRSDGTTETVERIGEIEVTAQRITQAEKAPDFTGQSLAQRNNNPGNLRSWPGVPVKDGYAVFPTLLAGARASFINLHTYMTQRNLVTLRDIIHRWAPQSENPTDSYIATVAQRTRLSPDQTLSYAIHARLVMPAMWRVEAGTVFWPASLAQDAYAAAGRA